MFMQAAYEAAKGRMTECFYYKDFTQALAIDPVDAADIAFYLEDKGLICNHCHQSTQAMLTPNGIDLVERMETLESPPPESITIKNYISDSQCCNININSRMANVEQIAKHPTEYWWLPLAKIGKDLLTKVLG